MKIYFQDGKAVYDDTQCLGVTLIDYSTLTKSQMKRMREQLEDDMHKSMMSGKRTSAFVTDSNKT